MPGAANATPLTFHSIRDGHCTIGRHGQGPDAAPVLDRLRIERLRPRAVGLFPQMPPTYSAKKIHGRRHTSSRERKNLSS